MGIAVPYLQKLQKEGESGRKTINQIRLVVGNCLEIAKNENKNSIEMSLILVRSNLLKGQ